MKRRTLLWSKMLGSILKYSICAVVMMACAACGDRGSSTDLRSVPPRIRFSDDRETPTSPSVGDGGAGEDIVQCEEQLKGVEFSSQAKKLKKRFTHLPWLTLHTRIRPVVYLQRPVSTNNPKARAISNKLRTSRRPRRKVSSVIEKHSGNKPLLRAVFLKQGYLYEENPEVARAVNRELGLGDLFDADELFRARGRGVERLKRHGLEYRDEEGRTAKLLLNDRVAISADELDDPLEIDLYEVRRLTGAQRTIPRALGKREAWLDLKFPDGEQRPALVRSKNGETKVVCIGGPRKSLPSTLAKARAFWRQHDKLVEAAELMVEERPRFDEPLDEPDASQEDGDLRLEWTKAYRRGKDKFKLREVEYDVFNRKGMPIPPQVCIDFVFDTWERSTGTWFARRGHRPENIVGEIDFSVLEDFSHRYIPFLLSFARREGTPFERYNIPPRHWPGFENSRRYARVLAKHTGAIREGDVLIIHGLREQDMQEHYHAVMVLATEPITGMPMVVADNQGRPRIGSLAAAMRTAPLRSIKHRIRLDVGEMKRLTRLYYSRDGGVALGKLD